MLYESIRKYCGDHNISELNMSNLIASEDNPGRSEKMWTIICSVLPRRSIHSCFRFIKRRFNKNNYKGEWSKEEAEELLQWFDKLGPRWKQIS
jgi:hypothetical protein